MELRQLAAFVAVADELHFGRAAERLGIVQPAVSRLVRRLEGELGVTLFERTSHRVTLTPAGAMLAERAGTVLADVNAFADTAAELADGKTGAVRIGTTEPMGPRLQLLLERFAAAEPGIQVDLQPAHTPDKLAALRNGELDAAFVRHPGRAEGLRVEVLWREPLVVVLPARHPRAAETAVAPADLADLPFLVTERADSPGVHDALLAAAHITLDASNSVARRANPPLLPFRREQEALALIATGAAWTLLEAGSAPRLPDVAVRPLPTPGATLSVALAWRAATPSPAVRVFVTTTLAARDAHALG